MLTLEQWMKIVSYRIIEGAVDLFRTKEAIGRYSTETVYGFYFAREKDVTMFKLAWG